jgi:hypothetical protein
MPTVSINYPLFVVAVVAECALAFFLCYFAAKARQLQRENAVTSKAYAELLAGSTKRESQLVAERDTWSYRAATAETDADRLAPIVVQYLSIIDETSGLLKDTNPPPMTAERTAMSLHQSALTIRKS